MHGKVARERTRRRGTKARLVSDFGGRCVRCGFVGCPDVYDFHHINPLEKEFAIGASNRSYERLKEEARKCVMLCANCHREVHAKLKELDLISSTQQIPLVLAPLAQQIEQFSSKESAVGANPTRGATLLSPIG